MRGGAFGIVPAGRNHEVKILRRDSEINDGQERKNQGINYRIE